MGIDPSWHLLLLYLLDALSVGYRIRLISQDMLCFYVMRRSNQSFDPLTNLIYLQGMTHSAYAGCNVFPLLVSLETAQIHTDDDFEEKK